jgi:hypothetical protein
MTRRLLAGLGIGTGLVLFALLFTAGGAFAYWLASTTSSVPLAVADTLPQGATPSAPTTADTVAVSFAQVDTSGGTPITGYVVKRYAPSSSTPSESFTCISSTSPVACNDPDATNGQWQYSDTPTYGTNWLGLESDKSPTVDVGATGPSVDITYPVLGSTNGSDWAGAITGTADNDANPIVGVSVAILDTTTNLWWDGSSFDQASQTFVPVTSGTASWSLTLQTSALTTGDDYSVTAQATDSVGTVGTSSTVTFSYANGPPPGTPEVPLPLVLPLACLSMLWGLYAWQRRRRQPRRAGVPRE